MIEKESSPVPFVAVNSVDDASVTVQSLLAVVIGTATAAERSTTRRRGAAAIGGRTPTTLTR